LYSPSVINLYLFRPIIMENTLFILNITNVHWVTVSNFNNINKTDDTNWYIYHSLDMRGNQQLFKKLFKNLLPNNDYIIFNYVKVQQQTNGYDCGLFAVAYAISLC
jgi:hypothetical protein